LTGGSGSGSGGFEPPAHQGSGHGLGKLSAIPVQIWELRISGLPRTVQPQCRKNGNGRHSPAQRRGAALHRGDDHFVLVNEQASPFAAVGLIRGNVLPGEPMAMRYAQALDEETAVGERDRACCLKCRIGMIQSLRRPADGQSPFSDNTAPVGAREAACGLTTSRVSTSRLRTRWSRTRIRIASRAAIRQGHSRMQTSSFLE